MHRTTPTIFLGHCPLPGQENTRISWYKPHSVIVLSNFVVTYVFIKYIYILAVVYLFPYFTFSDFSKSYFTFSVLLKIIFWSHLGVLVPYCHFPAICPPNVHFPHFLPLISSFHIFFHFQISTFQNLYPIISTYLLQFPYSTSWYIPQ